MKQLRQLYTVTGISDADYILNYDECFPETPDPRITRNFATMEDAINFVAMQTTEKIDEWEPNHVDDCITTWHDHDAGVTWGIYDHTRHGNPHDYSLDEE